MASNTAGRKILREHTIVAASSPRSVLLSSLGSKVRKSLVGARLVQKSLLDCPHHSRVVTESASIHHNLCAVTTFVDDELSGCVAWVRVHTDDESSPRGNRFVLGTLPAAQAMEWENSDDCAGM